MKRFFYDSYAVIEYVRDNANYQKYFEEGFGVLSLLNVLEVYYTVLSSLGPERAAIILDEIHALITEPSKETMKRAMEFRLQNKKSNFSYADALGYQLALERGIPFLTGDNQFKGMKNVEFVK